MQISHIRKVSDREQFLLQYIENILKYTEVDSTFARTLAEQILQQKWNGREIQKHTNESIYLYPTDSVDATVTAGWLITSLQSHPEYVFARGALAFWAQNYESPKDLVLGIVGLAIIGPTLGIISTKKKKKRKSQLILEQSFLKKVTPTELAILTTNMTQSVIAKETQLVGGNVYNLHPDSAAWCIEEALTQIYSDSSTNIQTLLRTAQEDTLSYVIEKDDGGNILALVISPSVNDSLVEDSGAEKI
jgi:hypothetical protein